MKENLKIITWWFKIFRGANLQCKRSFLSCSECTVKSFPFRPSTNSRIQGEEFNRRVPKTIQNKNGEPEKNCFACHITAFPRRRAGMPESWVPLTRVPSERWYRWCTPTDPGSCCRRPSHLKHKHSVSIVEHRDSFREINGYVVLYLSRGGDVIKKKTQTILLSV